MSISERLSAFLANPSQVLTRKRDISYLFGDIAFCEEEQYPDGYIETWHRDGTRTRPHPPSNNALRKGKKK